VPRGDFPPPAAAEFKYKGKRERKRNAISAAETFPSALSRASRDWHKSVALFVDALTLITRNETERSRLGLSEIRERVIPRGRRGGKEVEARRIEPASGTKGDGEARECLIRASGTECTEFLLPHSLLLPPCLFSSVLSLPRRGAHGGGEGRPGKRSLAERGERLRTERREEREGERENTAQWVFFWKIKVQRRYRAASRGGGGGGSSC